jgi:putative YhbY family RNA-binding protein
MITISAAQRRALRARAHSLQPVVSISEKGLSESVVKEIDVCLTAHELVKVRVYGNDRALRESYLASLCDQLGAAPVQHIGKLLVIWRQTPVDTAAPKKSAPRGDRSTKRSFQGSAKK